MVAQSCPWAMHKSGPDNTNMCFYQDSKGGTSLSHFYRRWQEASGWMVILLVKSWEDLLTWRSLGARKKSDKSALSSQSGWGHCDLRSFFLWKCLRMLERRWATSRACSSPDGKSTVPEVEMRTHGSMGRLLSLTLLGQVGWAALGHWKGGAAWLCLWVSWLPWAPLWWTTGDCSSFQCTHYICVVSPMSGLPFYLALKEKQGLCLTLGSLS